MYETGVLAAFCAWLFSLVATIVNANSRAAQNLAKLGMRFSIVSQEPKPIAGGGNGFLTFVKWVAVFGCGLCLIVFSWLYVAMVVGTLIYQKSKQSGMPQVVREFRWKLRNVDMPRDQLILEFMKVSGTPAEQFEEVKAGLIGDAEARGVSI